METTKTLNEFLLRFDDEGKFQGAHVVYLFRTVDPITGKQLTASLGNPQAIAKADMADRSALAAVVGEALLATTEAKNAADACVAEKDAMLAAKAAELAEKDAAFVAAEGTWREVDMAKDANIQALLADLEAANLAKSKAEAKVAELLPLAQLTDPSLVGL